MRVRESGLLVPEMRGHGKVELFDDRTLRKVEEVPFENVVTAAMMSHVTRRVGAMYARGFAQGDNVVGNGDPEYYDANWLNNGYGVWNTSLFYRGIRPPDRSPMQQLLCVDDSSAEHSTEVAPKAEINVVAWSNRALYVGGDTRRGTPNYLESDLLHDDYVKMVFDWPTTAGNGTFHSIMMADIHEALIPEAWGYTDLLGVATYPDSPVPVGLTPPVGAPGGALYYDMSAAKDPLTDQWYLISISGSQYKPHPFDPVTKEVSAALAGTWPSEAVGAGCDGTHFFIARQSAGAIDRYAMAGGLVSSISGLDTPVGACVVGTSLYYISGGDTLVEIHKDTGAAIDSVLISTLGADYRARISYRADEDMLYITTHAGQLVRVDRTGLALRDYQFHGNGNIIFDELRDIDGFLTITAYYTGGTNRYTHVRYDRSVGSRTLLGAPVTKSNLQTMKITYQFDYV